MGATQQLQILYHILEGVGFLTPSFTIVYYCVKYLRAVFRKLDSAESSLASIAGINTNVQTILDNHLPHLQMEASESRQQFLTLRDDIKGLASGVTDLDTKVTVIATKQDSTEIALHNLGQAFLHHIDKGTI